MAWLETFLAFALTMLVFSTVITIIIEGAHRLLRMREAGMKILLGNLFDKVIWERFEKLLAPKKQEEAREEFVKTLTGNGGMPVSGIVRAVMPKTIASLTSIQFAERLAQSDVAKKLVAELEKAANPALQKADEAINQVVKDLMQKFERFGADATEFFKRRSQVFALLIGFGLVFVVNFDAVQVFKAYLNDDKLREALIANSDAIQKQHMAAVERLKQTADGKGEAADSAKKLIEQLDKSRAEADKALADLRAKGVPIGWSRFPYCVQDRATPPISSAPSRNPDPKCEKSGTGDFIYWFLAVLLAGALVGLGGPFWYDTVRSLSSVLQLLRPSAPAAAPKPEPGVTFRGAPGTEQTRQPENPVEAFKTAANARKLVEAAAPPAQNPSGGAGANPGAGPKP